jgi:hypothetical protein
MQSVTTEIRQACRSLCTSSHCVSTDTAGTPDNFCSNSAAISYKLSTHRQLHADTWQHTCNVSTALLNMQRIGVASARPPAETVLRVSGGPLNHNSAQPAPLTGAGQHQPCMHPHQLGCHPNRTCHHDNACATQANMLRPQHQQMHRSCTSLRHTQIKTYFTQQTPVEPRHGPHHLHQPAMYKYTSWAHSPIHLVATHSQHPVAVSLLRQESTTQQRGPHHAMPRQPKKHGGVPCA